MRPFTGVITTLFVDLTHWLLPKLQALVILQANPWVPL